MMFVLLLAVLPFGIKALTLFAGATGYGLQSLYKIAQLLVPVGWRYAHGERGVSIVWPVSAPRPSVRLMLVAIGIALVAASSAIGLVLWLAPMFALDPATLRAGFDARFTVSGMSAVLIVVFLSFLNSALEELHFRVWLDQELSKCTNNVVGIIVSALAFGCMHGFILLGLSGVPPIVLLPMIIGLALAGACWSGLLRQPGGIYAAWLSHGLTDALLLSWGLFWLGYF